MKFLEFLIVYWLKECQDICPIDKWEDVLANPSWKREKFIVIWSNYRKALHL